MADKIYLKKLGDKIIRLRKEKSLRQVDLADMVGIEDSALRRIEKGKVNTSINMLRKIAQAFKIPLGSLVEIE